MSVLLFHCGVVISDSLFKFGYLGVYIFFPISGYCILNALIVNDKQSTGSFLLRRAWRIYPAYWGSIALIYIAIFAAMPFNKTPLSRLGMEWWQWASLLTLTQGFVSPGVVNVVYWSLGLEIQFYLLMGLMLLFKPSWRGKLLIILTMVSCYYRSPWNHWRVEGFLLEFLLEFMVGAAVLGWRVPDRGLGTTWSMLIFAMSTLTAIMTRNYDLGFSITFAILLIALHPVDATLMKSRITRFFGFFGMFSYSLYLIHYPIINQTRNTVVKLFPDSSSWTVFSYLILIGAGIAAGFMLYYLVERPCLKLGKKWFAK